MTHYLLQSGNILATEKVACIRTDNKSTWTSYSNLFNAIGQLLLTEDILDIIPVGSVEFYRAYAEIVGLTLPDDFSYGSIDLSLMLPHLKRKINKTTFALAKDCSFVKPVYTKLFTGNLKCNIVESDLLDFEVWESEAVEFAAEFRFYIHQDRVIGYSRYDSLDCECNEPDYSLVQEIIKSQNSFPVAYSIDIGWRDDINEWCLIELNDAWALGFYNNRDLMSKPPTGSEYAMMLAERWRQIVQGQLLK
jgi:hypothetical protein